MIQIHKSITLTPFHPTNGGMNAYKNFPSGRRVVLSNDNRYTPIATGEDKWTWEPLYGLTAATPTSAEKNGVPGVFGETFNVEEIPHQIITNGVVDMPTNMYFAVPDSATTWHPGAILVLFPNNRGGWSIAKTDPVVGTTPAYKNSNQQIGVLLKPLKWISSGGSIKAEKATVEVLVGYSKIPKMLTPANAVKATPLATPKVAVK